MTSAESCGCIRKKQRNAARDYGKARKPGELLPSIWRDSHLLHLNGWEKLRTRPRNWLYGEWSSREDWILHSRKCWARFRTLAGKECDPEAWIGNTGDALGNLESPESMPLQTKRNIALLAQDVLNYALQSNSFNVIDFYRTLHATKAGTYSSAREYLLI